MKNTKYSLEYYYTLLHDATAALDDAHAAYTAAQQKERDRDTAPDRATYKKVHAQYEKALERSALLFEVAKKIATQLDTARERIEAEGAYTKEIAPASYLFSVARKRIKKWKEKEVQKK